MNSLSWMIYFADVGQNIQLALGLLCGGTVVGGVAVAMVNDGYRNGRDEDEKTRFKWWKRFAIVAAIAGPIAVLIPAKATVYAMAASEYGEDAPEVTKARQALNAWLDKQIEPEKSK